MAGNKEMASEFHNEMQRFLRPEQINQMIKQNHLWDFIIYLIEELEKQLPM